MGNSLACIEDPDGDNNSFLSFVVGKGKRKEDTSTPLKLGGTTKIQILWEFQRFDPALGWGAGKNFETNDPGRWATEDETSFGDTLASVAPVIPDGYKVDINWAIVVKKKIRKMKRSEGGDVDDTGITDRFGWHYAKAFNSRKW